MRWFLCRYFSPRSSTPLLCPDAEAQQDFCSRNPVNLPKRFGRKETSVKMKRKGIQSDDSIVKEKTVNKIKTMLIKTRIMKQQRLIALMPWPLPTMVFPESVLSTARVPVPNVVSVFRYNFRIRKTCDKPYDFTGRAFSVDTRGNRHHRCLLVHFLLPFWAGRKEIKLL